MLLCVFVLQNEASAAKEGDFVYYIENGQARIASYEGTKTDVNIPNYLGGYPVTTIGYAAFSKKQLTTVVIPEGVHSIEGNAFSENRLSNVTLPQSLRGIGDGAFSLNSLQALIIPNNVKTIGGNAFAQNRITSITIPNSVESIEASTFYNNVLTTVVIGDGVKVIGDYAFNKNKITTLTLGKNVESIGAYAFAENQLRNVSIPASVKVLGANAFDANVNYQTLLVKFETNGGTPVSNMNVYIGSKITVPTAPTSTGYKFIGWYTNPQLTIPWNFASDTVTGNMTLYAKWEKVQASQKASVKFEANGGTAVATMTVDIGSRIAAPPAPTSTGYKFIGWYTNPQLTVSWNFASNTVTGNMTLYAKWEKGHAPQKASVTFVTNGGTAVANMNVDIGSKITAPPVPTSTGYKFIGWYSNLQLTEYWDFASNPVTGNMTLYAKWEMGHAPQKVLVKFATNGGGKVANMTVDIGSKLKAPSVPTRWDYKFIGWYTNPQLTVSWDFASHTVTGNMTLHAKWEKVKKVNVKFNSNGGKGIANMKVDQDTKINAPKTPTRKGYTFVGWYTDQRLKTAWNFSSNTVKKDMTLYAKWKENKKKR